MDYKDYYKVMGLRRESDEKEIKMAYRRLARKYHPDLSKEPHAEDKFKELGEAYEVLRDPEKRRVYDQYVADEGLRQQRQASSSQNAWGDAGASEQYSHDFFESLFGGAPFFHQQVNPADDLHAKLTLRLEEAYQGVVKELKLKAMQGQSASRVIKVNIPAGVRSGQKIRLAGQGGAGMQGGKQGDLYLEIEIEKHPLFDVLNNDVYLNLPVTPWEVALGATIVIPTLGGKVDLKIPPGSQGGQTLRLKNRGLPGKVKGDQYVILKIVTPKATTEQARSLYQKMAEEMPFNPREKMKGGLDE
jgi:curved DNA-binding protein